MILFKLHTGEYNFNSLILKHVAVVSIILGHVQCRTSAEVISNEAAVQAAEKIHELYRQINGHLRF